MEKSICVFAPATVANLTCGFDVLGLAVDAPGDEVIVKCSDSMNPGITIRQITGDNGKLPLDPAQNTATGAMQSLLNHIENQGHDKLNYEVIINKKMPLGSGMGSSAASAAAAVVALNELLELGLTRHELVPFAMDGEKIASGALHADNVAPALLGGITLVRSYKPLDIISIPHAANLYCSVAHPDFEVNTKEARALLPKQIELSKWTTSLGNLAGMITGLITGDNALLERSMQDEIIEPVRAALIPGFMQIRQAAINAGAVGVGISGSGPALFALSYGKEVAQKVAAAMQLAFAQVQINSQVFVSPINPHGVIKI